MLRCHSIAKMCLGDLITRVHTNGSAVAIGTLQGFVFLIPCEDETRPSDVHMLLDRGGEAIGAVFVGDDYVSAAVGDRRLVFWRQLFLAKSPSSAKIKMTEQSFHRSHEVERCSRSHVFQDGDKGILVTRASDEVILFSMISGSMSKTRLRNMLHVQSIPMKLTDWTFLVGRPKGDFAYKIHTEDAYAPIEANMRILSGDLFTQERDYYVQGDCCFTLSPKKEFIYSFDTKRSLLHKFHLQKRTSQPHEWRHGMIVSLCFCGDRLVILDSNFGLSVSSAESTLDRYTLNDEMFRAGDLQLTELLWFPLASDGMLFVSTGRELYHINGLEWMR
eukprot:TRINITY_DN10741_c0_g1_i1.p1 TRINITY_DN10741_c0_g1~~TRINITY_DN10741_c0_g1_i1.p1  ORF type:complete len:332 (-),score=62.84 TRINITY_DN10741_c0_g1_i1:72-1067(-)